MEKFIFNDFTSTDIVSDNVQEYEFNPIIIYSQLDCVKTANLYKDHIMTESSSNNPDEFKALLTRLYPEFKSDIICSIHETMIESGVHYQFEDVFDRYFKQNRHMAAQLLQRFLRENYANVRLAKVVLHIVSHYSYDEIGEDFIFPFSSMLGHENKAIRKFALKVFDNWNSVETLQVLQGTMHMKEKWLDDYKNRIIERLERKVNNAIFFTSD